MWDKKRFMSLFCDVSFSLISRLSCATDELETERQIAMLGLRPRVWIRRKCRGQKFLPQESITSNLM